MRTVQLACVVVLAVLLGLALASPLDLGYGGVYNSPEANAYWARRFGGLFGGSSSRASSLRALQVRRNLGFLTEKL